MFKIIWDKSNNGVRLTLAPPSGEALKVAPRPVFWEELDFLGLDKLGWTYPHSDAPLLWACDRRYFYKGNWCLKLKEEMCSTLRLSTLMRVTIFVI